MIFELALLRFFKDQLLNRASGLTRAGAVANAISRTELTGADLAAAAAEPEYEDSENAELHASIAPVPVDANAPIPATTMFNFGGKKAIYLAPLKSVAQRTCCCSMWNLFS